MAGELGRIATGAELVRAAARLAETGQRQVIRVNGTPVAVLAPFDPVVDAALASEGPKDDRQTRARRRRGRPMTMDDPSWNIVGIAGEAGPSHVGAYKDEYLAEAYASEVK